MPTSEAFQFFYLKCEVGTSSADFTVHRLPHETYGDWQIFVADVTHDRMSFADAVNPRSKEEDWQG